MLRHNDVRAGSKRIWGRAASAVICIVALTFSGAYAAAAEVSEENNERSGLSEIQTALSSDHDEDGLDEVDVTEPEDGSPVQENHNHQEEMDATERPFSPYGSGLGSAALQIINAERSRAGLAPVANSPELGAAAQMWANFMAGAGRLLHMYEVHGMNYQNKFAKEAGWQYGGDLIAVGYPSETAAANGWLASTNHRSWLMDQELPISAAGLGRAQAPNGARYWTLYVAGGTRTEPTPNFSVNLSVSGSRSSGSTLTIAGSISGVAASEVSHSYSWKDGSRTIGSQAKLNLTNAHAGKTLTATYTATHDPSGKSVSRSASISVSDIPVQRLSHSDRYGTNAAVANATATRGTPAFVATGTSFPDALSVGPAVAVTNGTLFLSGQNSVPSAVLNAMRSMSPSRVYVIGGRGAISDGALNQILAATGAPIERISGADRYATSSAIYHKFFAGRSVPMAFVATGRDYPDALTAAAAGGALKAPVVLIDGKNGANIDAGVRNSLRTKTSTVALVGGTGVVNPSIQANLRRSFGTVQRLSGPNRYSTNQAVNNYLNSRSGVSPKGMWIATGAGFPDALSAAVPAGRPDQRLVLSTRQCIPKPVVSGSIRTGNSQVSSARLVGGTGVLSSAVAQLTECR